MRVGKKEGGYKRKKGCASFRGTINAASVGGDAGRVRVDAGRVMRVVSSGVRVASGGTSSSFWDFQKAKQVK